MTITDSGTGGEGAYGGLVMGFGAFGSGDTACRELFKPHGLVSTFAYQSMTGRQAFFFESVESYVSEEEATQVLDNLESALSPCTEFTVQLDAGTMRFSYSLVRLSGGTSDTDELAHLMLGIGESSGRAIYIKQVRMGGEVLLFVLPSTEESVSYGDDAESRFIDVIGAYRAEHPRG